ncbi:MAG: NADP-dependent malic enzyme [Rhodobacterales bacterium]|nr:NADP-dependent malic enzyme [Rhodobacterales bacterium]
MADKQAALEYHEKGRRGKIEVVATKPLNTQRDLSLAYTPGVAEACRAIFENPNDVFKYTAKGNLVAVVTNGTAVLGLGNIGPEAGKPVMEGKANLFKKFADIDVFDIELNAATADEIVTVVKAMAPTFGGINLEDIKSPECFEVERRLQEELDIPVFHDDQHGTAIISAAALINALDISNRDIAKAQFVFFGAGAAALACARLYVSLGAKRENMVLFDSRGAITIDRKDLNSEKAEFAVDRKVANITEALTGADVFLGLSVGNVLTADMIMPMAPQPILFAMANPDPEIPYEVAKAARPDAIIATGRSDHPNQVNNVLGFPFVFRGALDCRARKITEEMKVAATLAISKLARADVPDSVLRAYGAEKMQYGPDYIIPKPFDPRVLLYVAPAVAQAAADSGVAREPIEDLDGYREWLHTLVERSRGLMLPLIRRARGSKVKPRIVFPDGANPKNIRAVRILVDEGICAPILLGSPEHIHARAQDLRISLDGVKVNAAAGGQHVDSLADAYWKLRQRKGVTLHAATAMLNDPIYYAAMMVRMGLADGMVGGPDRPYKHTLRPALRILGTDENSQSVSGVYAILSGDQKLFIGDCTVNIDPDAATMAEIALNTARVAETFDQTPRVAMLSYSDFGEHIRDPEVRKVREAVRLVRERSPDLEIDGEMQADTAMDPQKRASAFPFSTLTGAANVLIVPNLTAGNITYKLLERVANTEVLGPLLVGLAKPVNVIPVGASVENIVNVATYTATQALDQLSKAKAN